MRLWIPFTAGALAVLTVGALVGPDWVLPPIETTQTGYRGTGMALVQDAGRAAELERQNAVPTPPWEPDPSGERASEAYENVEVLGDLSVDQFNQFMTAITEWVSPEAGCAYCHNIENMASDEVYTKVVSRRMIEMTQAINLDWTDHVQQTGVTCYTCHRGNNIPANVFASDPGPRQAAGMLGFRDGQNVVSQYAGNTSLPYDQLPATLLGDQEIRVSSREALPTDNATDIKDTERTYALMIHMSEGLGANCSLCHNSRAFYDWDQSPPQRVSAWHGIRMARDINGNYIEPLADIFPDNRKGPLGDVLKVGCATCHNGVPRPLNGVSMLQDYVFALASDTSGAAADGGGQTEAEAAPADAAPAPEAEDAAPADEAAPDDQGTGEAATDGDAPAEGAPANGATDGGTDQPAQ